MAQTFNSSRERDLLKAVVFRANLYANFYLYLTSTASLPNNAFNRTTSSSVG